MVRAGLVGEVKAAVRHGTEVTQRVLGAATPGTVPVDTTTAYPINGAVDAATLAQLRADGLTTGLFASSSIRSEQTIPGAARVVADGDADRVSVPSVIAEADVLDGVGALISEGRTSGWAMRVNALTGVLTEQSAASSAAPSVFTPDRRWAPGASGLTVLTDLLATLGSNGVIEGVRLKQVAGGASVGAVPDYPTQARSQELPTSYLDRVRDNRNAVAALRRRSLPPPKPSTPKQFSRRSTRQWTPPARRPSGSTRPSARPTSARSNPRRPASPTGCRSCRRATPTPWRRRRHRCCSPSRTPCRTTFLCRYGSAVASGSA